MRRRFGSVARLVSAVAVVVSTTACAANDRAVTTGTLAPVTETAVWREAAVPSVESALGPESSGSTTEEEIRAAFDWLVLARIHCGRRPRECVVDDLAVPGSTVHTDLTRVFDERVRHGIFASDRGSHRHRISDVVMIADDRAEVRSCHIDDVVLMIGGTDARPSAIYDESLVSHWSTWTLEKVGDTWRWSEEIVDGRSHGEDRCA